jgi:thiol-disulfide isomerase/thioredoxin
MSRLVFGLLFSVCLLVDSAAGGEYNPVLSVGDAAPDWKDLPGIDGKKHSLSELKDHDTVVLFFICNSCDVVAAYEDRILELAKKHGGPKCAFVAVNVNKVPEDNLEAMKKRAVDKKYPFVYLFDESQKIAKDYGANWTPEFFILDKSRRVAYLGGVDDQSNAKLVKKKYLEPALEAVLAGKKPAVAETAAIGCAIRYERERRKRPAP